MSELVKVLQNAIEKELMSEELGDLDSEIYVAVSSRIKELKELHNESSETYIKIIGKEIELLSSLVQELFLIRVTKFFLNTLKGRNEVKLTLQEKYIVDPMIDSIKRLQKLEEALQYGFSRYLENLPRYQRRLLVVFLKSTDKFVGSDLKTYGPYESGDIALIPIDSAKIFIDKNIAVDIGVV